MPYQQLMFYVASLTTDERIVKIVDLFAGMGGLRLAVETAFKELGIDVECVLTSEIKESAIVALKKNFKHKNLVGDITKFKTDEIEDFDILLAGFPCQPFSYAGKWTYVNIVDTFF